jgi:hypothetical protein
MGHFMFLACFFWRLDSLIISLERVESWAIIMAGPEWVRYHQGRQECGPGTRQCLYDPQGLKLYHENPIHSPFPFDHCRARG